MFSEEGHPDVALSDWETFRREFSPYLVEEVVDRAEIELPEWYVPLARGAAVPSSHLLERAGYRAGSCRARGWCKPHYDLLWKDIGPDSLIVRGGKPLWQIERNGSPGRPHNHPNRALVHVFGATPILTRNYQSATFLAEFCYMNGPPPGLRWVDECPDDWRGIFAFAQKRRIEELVAGHGLAAAGRCSH